MKEMNREPTIYSRIYCKKGNSQDCRSCIDDTISRLRYEQLVEKTWRQGDLLMIAISTPLAILAIVAIICFIKGY
jgi:hypothetical protein